MYSSRRASCIGAIAVYGGQCTIVVDTKGGNDVVGVGKRTVGNENDGKRPRDVFRMGFYCSQQTSWRNRVREISRNDESLNCNEQEIEVASNSIAQTL